jgi:hypothetical protein
LNLKARNPHPSKQILVRRFSCLPALKAWPLLRIRCSLIKFESGNEEPTFPEKGCFLRMLKLVQLQLSLAAPIAVLRSISEIPFRD